MVGPILPFVSFRRRHHLMINTKILHAKPFDLLNVVWDLKKTETVDTHYPDMDLEKDKATLTNTH